MTYYISLTRGLTGYYVQVEADNESIVREYAGNYYGRLWCSVYEQEDLQELKSIGYKTIVINEGDPVVLGDSPLYE